MGKYMRKSKLTGDVVAVIDVSPSSLGVRTRAKTLALQKLRAPETTATPLPEQNPDLSYLQLRSRRLEKPSQQNPNPGRGSSRLAIRSGDLVSIGSGNQNVSFLGELLVKLDDETEDYRDLGAEEASFGENNIEFDGRERSTRESTPCNLTRDLDGSSTRPTNLRIMPSALEIEEVFARQVQEQQRRFADKYNFDIMNEKPLQGRYEWVRVQP